jgi:hypothetical protein
MRSTDRSIRRPRASWKRAVALGAVGLLALGACGGDDDDDASGSGTEVSDDGGESGDGAEADAAAFCTAYVDANNATAAEEGDPTAAFEAAQASAPDEIADDVAAMIENAPGPQEVPEPVFFEANEAVGAFVEDNCDFEVVEISTQEYSFDMPDEISSGTVLVKLSNEGNEVHEFVAFGIPEEETRSIEELLALPEEEAMTAVTPVTGFAFAVPGGTFYTTYDFETPGRHAGVCFIPVGLTVDAAQSGDIPEDAAPHFMEGMVQEFEVTA